MISTIQARRMAGTLAFLIALCATGLTQAHMAAEQFIPIGQSPGVSHVLTEVGKIETVDAAGKSITMATPSEKLVFGIEAKSKIWLDRTKLKQSNLVGSFADLKTGSTIEVKFVDPSRKKFADWIKIEAPAPR
jgi:hypothetical protein